MSDDSSTLNRPTATVLTFPWQEVTMDAELARFNNLVGLAFDSFPVSLVNYDMTESDAQWGEDLLGQALFMWGDNIPASRR